MIKLFHNLHLKILALFAGVILWIFVVGIENSVFILPESLELKTLNMSKSISVETVLPQIKVYVRVDQNSLKTVTKNDFAVSLDLNGLSAGDYQLPVQAESKNPQATVLKTEPATVSIRLVPLAEKEVPVTTSYKGSPMTGFNVKEVTSATTTVHIAAAKSILDRITFVQAEIILNGAEDADVTQTVLLSIPELNGVPKENFHIDPEELSISAVIVPQLQQKIVTIKPVITGSTVTAELMQRVQVLPATVAIQGESTDIKNIETIDTIPVDAAFLERHDQPFEIGLVLPKGVSFVNAAEIIQITLKKPAAQATTPAASEQDTI